jgi:dihydrofolate reductase
VHGAEVVNQFIRLGLADEIRLWILPILLGDGTPFFARDGQERALHLKAATAYRTGTVELCYELRRE